MKIFISFVITLLLMFTAVVADAAENPFWVGIVRIDGILVPIGTYAKDKWVNTWPEVSIDEQPEVDKLVKATNGKVNLQDIPKSWRSAIKVIPSKVYLWSQDARPKLLKVLHAEQYPSHCSGGWALKTDLQPSKTVDYSPTPKVGIASNYDTNVNPFETIKSGSKVPAALMQAIKTKFQEKEKAALPLSRKDKVTASIELPRIYKARYESNGKSIYFIEAQRKYEKPKNAPDAGCYNLNSLNSWVASQGNELSFLRAEFVTSDCDGKEMNYIVPDAIISISGKFFTVSESYGYEWESYRIDEILDDTMKELLNVNGGGC